MKRWALMSGEAVVNVVEQETMPGIPGEWRDCTGHVIGPGQNWDGTPTQAPAPVVVTMRQARLALRAAGKLAAVDAAITAMPEPARTAARIEWDYATEVRRDWPLVLALAPALGLDEAALDALFAAAVAL